MAKKQGFARARVEKLIKDAGAERVSAAAIDKLNEILMDKGTAIAKRAIAIAKHSGRRTVKDSDIKLAAEAVLQ